MKCKLRNVSSSANEMYQTMDSEVRVVHFKRRLWSVQPRGSEPFLVSSKKTAFSEACGIAAARKSGRHPGRKRRL